MDKYNLLKNVSEVMQNDTVTEYGYTDISENLGTVYTLDFSVISAADKCEGKFAAKVLQFKTVNDLKNLPENVLGYYVIEDSGIVRIKRAVKGAFAVCYSLSGEYINFTGAKAVLSLFGEIGDSIINADTVFVNNNIYPTDIVWSSTLKKAYEEKYHEDIRDKLALLFVEAKGSARFRNRYYSLLGEIVYSNFLCQLKGKAISSGTKLALNVFDVLTPYSQVLPSNSLLQYISVFDRLLLKADALNSVLLKIYGSASLQFGSEIIAEISGSHFVNDTLNELRNTVDKLFANGVKKIGIENIHRYAKFDVLAKKAEYLSNYINLSGAFLSQGTTVADTLVVYSNNTAFGIYNPQNRTEVEKFSAFINNCLSVLTQCGLSFHICDERILKDFISVTGNRIKLGQHQYSKLVLVGADNISFTTANVILDYAGKGGKIFTLGGKPRLIDGVISERMQRLGDSIVQIKLTDAATLKLNCEPRIKGEADVRTFRMPDGSFMYLLADVKGEAPTVTFNTYEDVLQTDLSTKSEYVLENKNRMGRITGKSVFSLNSGTSSVLRVVKSGTHAGKRKNAKYIGLDPIFDITNVTDNCLVINCCQWRTGRNKWQSAEPVTAVLRQLSYINKNYTAEFKFTFNIEQGAVPSVCKLAVKNAERFNITVNGNTADSAAVADISGIVREGENTVLVSAREFNLLLADNANILDNIRVLGNFGVKNNAEYSRENGIVTQNNFTITKLPESVNINEITQSGFWFFGGTIELSQTITVPEKEGMLYKFGFSDFKAQLAEVFVNGISAGCIGFAPFELPVSDLLYQGENTITVKLYSGVKNYNILNSVISKKLCFEEFGGKIYDRIMAYVKLSGVTKSYKNGDTTVNALNDITFGIERGEFVVISGPDGSGKTTIFNILAGTQKCDTGEVTVDDRVINELTVRERDIYRRDDVALILPENNLLSCLTVAENIELAAKISKEPLDTALALAAVGLSGHEKDFPSQLDNDACVRAAVARALAKNPKIILCDEPICRLDSNTGKAILSLLLNVCKNTGKTVIVITHNSAVSAIADRSIKIKDGAVIDNSVNTNPVSPERIEL